MKKLLAIILLAGAFGFALHKIEYDKPREQPKLKIEVPPGTVWLRDSLFIDKMEVRNLDYLEFMYWASKNDTALLRRILPDTIVWRDTLSHDEPCVQHYLRDPWYRDYPVVGVSYEQALEYCAWRTKMVNRFIHIRDHKMPKGFLWDTVEHVETIVQFRLPAKEEWEYAAAAGLSYERYPQGYQSLYDENGFPVTYTSDYWLFYTQYQSQRKGKQTTKTDLYIGLPAMNYTTAVNWGKPNAYAIYNLGGNVSEMIAGRQVKGLNSDLDVAGKHLRERKNDYELIDSTTNGYDYKYTFRYQQPRAWLGFRCVAEVKK